MSDPSDLPKSVRVFLGDSVPTAHLPKLQAVAQEIMQRTAPTGHLPFQPSVGEPGASVPTGHLPSAAPAPTPPPTTGSGDKK